jgi:hypothetical protein
MSIAGRSCLLRCFLLVLVVCGLRCRASPTSLIIVPIADVVGASHYSCEFQTVGVVEGDTDTARFINTEFGFRDVAEAGVDFNIARHQPFHVLYNAKFVVHRASRSATAIGSLWAPGIRSQLYITACRRFGFGRFHFGLIDVRKIAEPFFGFDKLVGARTDLQADYTAGPYGVWSLGLQHTFSDRLQIQGGIVFPNVSADSTTYTLHFIYSGSF